MNLQEEGGKKRDEKKRKEINTVNPINSNNVIAVAYVSM